MTNRKYIKLKSVGTAIDINTLVTFAINVDNTIDYSSAVYIDDCCQEWWCRLSNKDNPFFTKKILEVRKKGVGKLPEARIVLPKKILH